jgi:tetratricopeptide (TPR) repeat protein
LKGLRNKKGVLLWGFGGVGKTNLAAHAAYYASRWFKDGVIWLHVGQSDVYALCDGIARALNDDQLQRLPAHEKPDAVRRLLGGKRAFLVLDNVVSESTLREAPALCPSTIGLIATSRQNSASYGVRVELRSLEYRHARLLFCKRADLPSSKADDPNIAAICQAWKGYPLGIVLSAGRFLEHNLPLDRLVHHLRQIRLPDESLKYVSPELDQVHTLLENHFQPLTPKEIVLLNTIANNFGKSIRLAFLANIAQLSELEAETALGNLVRAALVTSSNGYYAVHDIIREALLVRMPAKENLRLKLQIAKNLEVFLESRLSFEGRWCVAPPKAWHEVEPEFDNCMGAIQWCLEHSHLKLAWNLYRLIDYPLGNLGYWDQEDQICKEVIAKAGYFDPGQTAWWKLNTLAFTHWERDETDEAEALTQEAWEIFSGLNDKIGIGEAVLMKANILVYKLKHDAKKNLARYKEMLAQTQFLFEQAIATFESQKDLRNLARAEGDFADYWYYSCDRPEIALTHCQRSIGIYSQLDEEEGLTLSQPPLCDIYISLGDLVKAEAMLEPMRLAARKLGRPDFEPQVDWSEADLREHQGDKLIRKKNKRKALAFYRKSLKAATRCKEAFVRIRMPFEARELLMQERRLKSKIKKLSH